jgi:ribonuclease HI
LRNIKFETIDPTKRNRAENIRFTTFIAKSREVSISYERNDTADYKAYSDGSGQEEGIGASAVLYRKGFVRPVKTIQAYMGTKTKHNTYEAEVAGALLATWIIRNTPETIGKTVSLYIDNQATVMALAGSKTKAGQYLINSTVTAANGLPCNLTIRWISSHSEVRGNEAADKLAKEAAQGRSSRQTDLPHLFRSPLPVSASATKQAYNAKLNKMWAKIWTNSPRKDRFTQTDPDFPFNSFRKRLFMLTRNQASIIMQIRVGHIPLNYYLRRIGKTESDKCLKCDGNPNNGQRTETINHFVFECSAYNEARTSLVTKIGRNRFTIPKIMENTKHMKALVTYVNRTGRFKEDN